MLREVPRAIYLWLCVGLILANILIYRAALAPDAVTITALAVGKGNATLVRAPNETTILIDTGADASILRALGSALPPWQREIDLVILTSTKKNSAGGLQDVLNRYAVREQITITQNKRLSFSDNSYVDITLTPDGPTITK